ncbi:MAG: hypothetical protein DSZ05_00230 [Sulfurospirillum sp.]|nr:MAG: hypothetical protein DSZ05_00230 [Sulfurospirillum sp.]
MKMFFTLEAGNLTIALFFLLIAIIVATRPFVRTQVKKFILFTVITVFAILIAGHYIITTGRMAEVKTAFAEGKEVECESRLNRKAAQSVVVSKKTGWKLEGDLFTNPNFTRTFHTARCIVKVKPKLDLKSAVKHP